MPDADDIIETPTEVADEIGDAPGADEDADQFPREYVEKIRKESAGYRDRARTAETERDELAVRLHTELVRATGRLADPTDLQFDADHLVEADKLTASIDALVASKPHLKARAFGDAGQGAKSAGHGSASFASLLRQR
ncbi:hypothetical protein [Mycolicibacterium mengxianglii]|uniref:hypothetical protein n=1 Tax=Mycolicibacterium mengxianglii TaxID=2736649 RepID=UPI0018D1423A|nr:hypothetical protein [Mycolicibacterium mengxianglii]